MEQTKIELIRSGYELIRTITPKGLLDMGECIEVGKYGIDILEGKSPSNIPEQEMYDIERKRSQRIWKNIDKNDVRFLQ